MNHSKIIEQDQNITPKLLPLLNKASKLGDFITYSFKNSAGNYQSQQICEVLAAWYSESIINKGLPFDRDFDRKYDKNGYHILTLKNTHNNTNQIEQNIVCSLRLVIKKNGDQQLPTEDAVILKDSKFTHNCIIEPTPRFDLIDIDKYCFPEFSIEPTSHRADNLKAMALTFRKMIELCVLLEAPMMIFLVNNENKMHQSIVYKLGCRPILPFVFFPTFGEVSPNGVIDPTIWQPWIISLKDMQNFIDNTFFEIENVLSEEASRLKISLNK